MPAATEAPRRDAAGATPGAPAEPAPPTPNATQGATPNGEPNAPAAAPRPRRAALLAAYAAVYVIWGSTYLAIRYGIATLPPFGMAGARFLAAGALLYAWARVRGAARPTPRQWGGAAVVGALLLLVGNGGVTWAEQRVPSGVAALLVATEPLWVVLLSWWGLGGPRPTLRTALGLVLGLAGVAVLVGGGSRAEHAASGAAAGLDLVGVGAVLVGATAWAAGSLWSISRAGKARLPQSAPLATGMQMLAGGALLCVASAAAGEPRAFHPAAVSGASLAALGYLATFGSIVAFSAYIWLLKVEPPARAASYAFVNPVVAVLLGWAVAGEPLTTRVLVAAAVIVAALVLLTLTPRRDRAGAEA